MSTIAVNVNEENKKEQKKYLKCVDLFFSFFRLIF